MFSQSADLDLHSRSQLRLKLNRCFTCDITVIYRTLLLATVFKLGMTVAFCMADNYAHARVVDLDLGARSQWFGRFKTISGELSRRLSKQ